MAKKNKEITTPIANKKMLSAPRARVVFLSWFLTAYMAFGLSVIPSFSAWYVRVFFLLISVYLFGGMNLIEDLVKRRKYKLTSFVIYIVASLLMLIFLPLYNLGLSNEYFLDQFVCVLTVLIYFSYKLYRFVKQK